MNRTIISTIAIGFLFLISQSTKALDTGKAYIAEPPWFGIIVVDEMTDSENMGLITHNEGVRLTIIPNVKNSGLTSISIERKDWVFPMAALEETHQVQVRIGTDKAEYLDWHKSSGKYEYTNELTNLMSQDTYDRLKRADTLTVRLTPMTGSTETITFPIGGLAEAEDFSNWEALDRLVDDGLLTEDKGMMLLEVRSWMQVEKSFLLP